jgi:hypothetical protein
VLIVRPTSNADVELLAVGSRVSGISVQAGEGAAVRPEVPISLEAGDSRIVAGCTRSLPVLERRTVTVWWDGAAGRETETVEWLPHPSRGVDHVHRDHTSDVA